MVTRTLRARGRVVSGLGEGGRYVAIYSGSFQRALGYIPFPGTLNVLLSAPLDLSKCAGKLIEPPSDKYREVYAYPARIMGLSAHVVRPRVNKHGDNVLELIAPINIREGLGLREGDEVEIEIECAEVI